MKIITLSFILLSLCAFISSQATNSDAPATSINEENGATIDKESSSELPTGYGGYNLGDSRDTVIENVKNDASLVYVDEESMLNEEDKTSLEVAGVGFLKRVKFIFKDEKLYTLIIEPDPKYIDFGIMNKTFNTKYGKPTDLNPTAFYWFNDSVQISIEKPCVVKYIDKATLDSIKEDNKLDKTARYSSIDEFLNSF